MTVTLNIGNICDNVDKYIYSLEEGGFIEELIVIVKKDRVMIHRRESNCGNPKMQMDPPVGDPTC